MIGGRRSAGLRRSGISRGSCAGGITFVFSFDFIVSGMGNPAAPERGRVQIERFRPLSCFSFFLVYVDRKI